MRNDSDGRGQCAGKTEAGTGCRRERRSAAHERRQDANAERI
jgi:hypothetical protein